VQKVEVLVDNILTLRLLEAALAFALDLGDYVFWQRQVLLGLPRRALGEEKRAEGEATPVAEVSGRIGQLIVRAIGPCARGAPRGRPDFERRQPLLGLLWILPGLVLRNHRALGSLLHDYARSMLLLEVLQVHQQLAAHVL